MTQLLLHLIGDYVTQSHWMAENKTKRSWPALVHATLYALPFLLIGSVPTVLVIWFTHFFIDRFRLARWIVWAKNILGSPMGMYKNTATGYPEQVPQWLAVWLLIAADNTIHLTINWGALRWIG